MSASWNGNIELARMLVEAGADVNITDDIGETALSNASMNGQAEMVEYLKSMGAVQ